MLTVLFSTLPSRLPRLLWLAGVVLLVAVVGLGLPLPAAGHAALESSSPAAGAVLPGAPAAIEVRFTEPLERSYSRMELYDRTGARIESTSLSAGEDDYSMVLAVPAGLPNGTYSVLWRTLSSADGHTAENYFAFTIGTNVDVVPVVAPGAGEPSNTVPQWARTFSRWAALTGITLLIAAWPVWSTVIRPALRPLQHQGPAIARRMRRYVKIAVTLAIAGSVAALVVQSLALTDGPLLDKTINTLGQTRYGQLWLVRVGLIAVLAVVLAATGWWFPRRRQAEGIMAWVASAAVPLPFSLIAHASAQPSGRTFAVVADAVHLGAASVWIGGLAILSGVLLPGLRGATAAQRRQVLAIAVPRFSVLGLIAMATLGITGAYAGWLHVGNLAALTGTPYGRALLVKLGLLTAVLALAAINLVVISRRLRRAAAGGGAIWTHRLRWTVGGELALVLLLLAAVGQMTSLQPARDVMIERSRQITVPLEAEGVASGVDMTLRLAPGIAGNNHFRLDVDGRALPAETEALLRLTIPDRDDLGTKEIPLARAGGNGFEHHGTEMSIAGDWRLTAIIRPPGQAPITAERLVTIGTSAPDVDVPAHPWRFSTTGGVSGLVLILLGVSGLVIAAAASQSRTARKESGGLGVAALLLGIVLLVQARIDPALANAGADDPIDGGDVAMVTRGEAIYASACLSCHGPELRGDGPAGAGMSPPPADFLAPHAMVHSAEDLVYWVRNGKQGTGMPAFGDTLGDGDILDVLSYIERRQGELTAPATPAP